MERVIKLYDNDQEWYVLSGKSSGDDLFTTICTRVARANGIRLSSASEEEKLRIEDLARTEFAAWDEANERDRLTLPEFRRIVLSELKTDGDLKFIDNAEIVQRMTDYMNRFWFREALYLLSLMDTLYAERKRPRARVFPALHDCKLAESLSAVSLSEPFDLAKGLPLFAERNIYEPDIRSI